MRKKKVLIIDDEEGFCKITKLNLELTNKYEVLALLNVKDIIATANKFKPDIILLDLLMPEIGGLDVCEMLNNDPHGKNIPIIILSALEKDADKLKAYELGVVDYLVKPIEIDKLIMTIEKALRFK